MSIISPPTGPDPAPYPMHKLTVAEYHQLIQLGVLTAEDRVELLEGWIVPKMPHNPPHDGTVSLAQEVLRLYLPADWHIRSQCAITTNDSEPEPDLAVVCGNSRDYMSRHPGPADSALVVEVADSTLASDRLDKVRLYARAGIVMYWIINLVDAQVEVYSAPTGPAPAPGYRQRHDYSANDAVPLVIEGRVVGLISVRELLP